VERLFAAWRGEYVAGTSDAERAAVVPECVFCRIVDSGPPSAENGVLWRGERTLAVLNLYPYASGHLLVLPLRHEDDLRKLDPEESAELWETTRSAAAALEAAYGPDGLNLGANLGRAAGAGIPRHLHLHVLPRWLGDTNFMTTVADVRVLPESLEQTWEKVHAAWPSG